MSRVVDFHPDIQTFIQYFSVSDQSLRQIGANLGISKQAVQRRINKVRAHLEDYGSAVEPESLQKLKEELKVEKLEHQKSAEILKHLRQQLIIKSVVIYLMTCLLDKVRKFIPKLKLGRLKWYEKKYLLEMAEKFQKAGGTLMAFCHAVNKSPSTIIKWKKNYAEKGKAGLVSRTTRPKNFGNKVPSWVKKQLLNLFLRFPRWTEYQYHSYIRHNPATNWYISLPTIKKLKSIHQEKSASEKERILKRWSFAKGTEAWTVDYTTILKTANYSLKLLTVSDVKSRYLLNASLHLDTNTEQVIKVLEDLFIKHGKPKIIKADNGPEFRIDCKDKLSEFSVYLLNNPNYYGQFNGAHERIHRTIKAFISQFSKHKNLTRLVQEINEFTNQYNNDMKNNYLKGKTPFEVFISDDEFIPENTEVITPYEKEGELRIKFKNRVNKPARIGLPLID